MKKIRSKSARNVPNWLFKLFPEGRKSIEDSCDRIPNHCRKNSSSQLTVLQSSHSSLLEN